MLLETEVSWESDFHESFTIHLPLAEVPGVSTLISRLINFGADTGNGTYITNPTTCFDPEDAGFEHLYSTWFRAESYEDPDPNFPNGSTAVEAPLPAGIQQEGCERGSLRTRRLEVEPGTNVVDSPAPATVTTDAALRKPRRRRQRYRSVAPAQRQGDAAGGHGPQPLGGERPGRLHRRGVRQERPQRRQHLPGSFENRLGRNQTPRSSRTSLKGDIYVGEQKSSDPTSGEEFRILVEAKEPEEGIVVRLVGNISADPVTGQLTTTFDEQEVGPLAGPLPKGLPQVPFEAVTLRFDGAAQGADQPADLLGEQIDQRDGTVVDAGVDEGAVRPRSR